ncbi:hypothetical protein J7643_11785 [bacterium]|nr:hypothetical protein [bacterium]
MLNISTRNTRSLPTLAKPSKAPSAKPNGAPTPAPSTAQDRYQARPQKTSQSADMGALPWATLVTGKLPGRHELGWLKQPKGDAAGGRLGAPKLEG